MSGDHPELASLRTIDLTTIGRRSGLPQRIEIWWFHVDGRFIISGGPGRRDWLANIYAHPKVTIHANDDDIPARAIPIDDQAFRRSFFTRPATSWYSTQSELENLIDSAPMVEIVFDN